MQCIQHLREWRDLRRALAPDLSIGFVPTMGNLHAGHASLYEKSRSDNDLTFASLFINPTQFNRVDDLIHYPRTLDDDLSLLADIGVDYCLLPHEKDMYPDDYHYQIHENHQSLLMEGIHRSGHFTGMLTVVMKLLQLIKPHRAYFGEKDHQQLHLIRGMVEAFFIDTDIISCPTIREPSGLAKSSRNHRLTIDQRQVADQFARIFHQKTRSTQQLKDELKQLKLEVQYLQDFEGRRYVAVNIGEIRLIDNYAIQDQACSQDS
ncbi:MAG: pantoate--beta-alanine ligase [Legionellales bacterium]|nr:pantoate--beta-alanine ligase [Legionellales bacterium]